MEETAVAKDNGFTLRLDPAVAVYISDGGGNRRSDNDIIRQSIAYRSKYKTKRQPPRLVLSCLQIGTHPLNLGGDNIRSETAKSFAANICHEGYNPIEAELESVCVWKVKYSMA